MQIPKPWKTVLGVLTVLQLFVGLFYLVWFLSVIAPVLAQGSQELIQETLLNSLGGLMVSIVLLILISTIIMIFYVIHAAKNKSLTSSMKALWITLIVLFGSVVEVIYFFMEVVPEKSMTMRFDED